MLENKSHLALLLVGVKGERSMPYPMVPRSRHITAIIIPFENMINSKLRQLFEVSLKNATPMELFFGIFASRVCEELVV